MNTLRAQLTPHPLRKVGIPSRQAELTWLVWSLLRDGATRVSTPRNEGQLHVVHHVHHVHLLVESERGNRLHEQVD
jgi:hypothetical protein